MEHIGKPARRVMRDVVAKGKKRSFRENDNQKAIVEFAKLALPRGWKIIAIPNAAKRNRAEAGVLIAMGLHVGASDLTVIAARPYPSLYFETKADGKEPTEKQYEFGRDVEALGHVFGWGETVEAFYETCIRAGYPMRARPQ